MNNLGGFDPLFSTRNMALNPLTSSGAGFDGFDFNGLNDHDHTGIGLSPRYGPSIDDATVLGTYYTYD